MYKSEVLSLSFSLSIPSRTRLPPLGLYREGPCAGPVSSLCALIMAPGTKQAIPGHMHWTLTYAFLSCMLIEK